MHGHDHAHGHHHHHPHEASRSDARTALVWALALNAAFLFVEAGAGYLTGSLALLSDAAHMLSDVGALGLALFAAQLAARPAGGNVTYGLARAEVLGAFVNGISLLGACAWIAAAAVGRLYHGSPEVLGWPMLVVATIGLAINLGSAWKLSRASGGLNLRAAFVHMMADALGSVGAMVAGVLVLRGWPLADTVVSLGIAALVLWGTMGLLRDSARVLLEVAPAGLSVGDIRDALRQVDGVVDVHDLHVWTLGGDEALLSAHVVTSSPGVLAQARARLRERFGIVHATLQEESVGCGVGCGDASHE